MGTQTMGQVKVKAKIENLGDFLNVRAGKLSASEIRSVEVNDALVDTGAKFISLPPSLIQQLGLNFMGTRQARTTAGIFPFKMYSAVWLTIEGRECAIDVSEVPEGNPVLIGVLALEALDFIVDPVNQRLVGNPAHGGENMMDMF